ncbi:MAG: hypothetical protein ACTSPQ_21585, partial [Candidatus Helarchaeota archaeon]
MTKIGGYFSNYIGWKEVTINLDLNETEYVETINFGRFTGDLSEENNLHIGDYFYIDWVKAYVPMNVENGNITQTLDSSEYNDVFMFEFVSNSSEFDAFTNEIGDTCDFKEDLEGFKAGSNSIISLKDDNYLNLTEVTDTNDVFGMYIPNFKPNLQNNKYIYIEIKFKLIADIVNNEELIIKGSDYYIVTSTFIYQYNNQWKILRLPIIQEEFTKNWFGLVIDVDNSGKNDSDQLLIDYIKLIKDDYPLENLNNGDINVTLSDDSGHSQLINQEILDNHLNYTWGNSSHYETISQFAISKMLFQLKYGFYPTKVTISMNINSSLYLLRLGEYYIYGENTYTLIDLGYTYTFIPNYNFFFDYSDSKGDNKKFDLDISDLYYLDNLGNKTEFQKYKHQFISFKGYPTFNKLLFILDEFYNIDNLEKGFWAIYFNYTQNLDIECVDNEFNSYIIWNFFNNGSLLINNYATLTNSLVVRTNLTDIWLTLEQISFGQIYMFKHSLSGQTTFAGKYFTNITMGDLSQWHNVPLINNSISGFHDYAQEVLGDAWDFEEGDKENNQGLWGTETIKNGYSYMISEYWSNYDKDIIIWQYGSSTNKLKIDSSYYTSIIFRIKTNISDTSSIAVFWENEELNYYAMYIDINNNSQWNTYIYNLKDIEPSKWIGKTWRIGIFLSMPENSGDTNFFAKLDFIRLVHLDGLRFYHEDKNFGDLIDF